MTISAGSVEPYDPSKRDPLTGKMPVQGRCVYDPTTPDTWSRRPTWYLHRPASWEKPEPEELPVITGAKNPQSTLTELDGVTAAHLTEPGASCAQWFLRAFYVLVITLFLFTTHYMAWQFGRMYQANLERTK